MNSNKKPRTGKDRDGREIVRVPLGPAFEHHAVLYAEDYKRFCEQYGDNAWYATQAKQDCPDLLYVRVSYRGRSVMVARLLLGAGAGRGIVRYVDGNTLNLRRNNLRVVVGTDERRRKREMKARLAEMDAALDRDIARFNPALDCAS
jgi:hypothetical protein